jgi:hypothetical protein
MEPSRPERLADEEQEVNKMEGGSAGMIHLLDGVDRDDIEALLEVGHKVFIASGESIFDTGDEADGAM